MVIFLALSHYCISQEERKLDGNAWLLYSESEKYIFFNGFKIGAARVWELLDDYKNFLNEDDEYQRKNPNTIAEIEGLGKVILLDLSINDPEQLIDGIDSFYEDYANKHIFIHHALLIVQRRIRGTPEDKIKELIQEYRRLDSSQNLKN